MRTPFLTILTLTTVLVFNQLLSAQDDFFVPKTTIGGYGELHYNNEKPDGSTRKETLDFHRFVIFIGHSWSEKWSFNSEIEIEHNFVESGQGELELEQAYINYQPNENIGFQAGVIIPSIGLINPYHEPPLFFGVERPDYSKFIIPTTWFGNGAAVYGNIKDFSIKLTVMEGLNSDKFSASSGIRKGRQKGFKSNASKFLYSANVDYLGVNGLLIGGSFTYNEAIGKTSQNRIILTEFHGKYDANNFIAVFEYGNISYENGNIENSKGYYFDLGYNLKNVFKTESEIIPFFRYTDYNTAANTISGGTIENQYHFSKWMIGVSIKPIPFVVLKLDYGQKERELGDVTTNLFNLGVGYMF
ncbi:MAG: hypothetical protein IIC75_05335 [Bacteroidetes bacterium]|nr:hypothetical protein [Bacteroidota bacterium]